MTVYDYLTPFENQDRRQEYVSQVVPTSQSMTEERPTTASASPETPCLDVSAAHVNNSDSFATKILNSDLPYSCDKVHELFQGGSTDSSSSDACSGSSTCRDCGRGRAANGLLPEHNCHYTFADIPREQEDPEFCIPTELGESQARSRRSSDHHHRRHSLLHECAYSVGRQELHTIEEKSNHDKHIDNPLQDECGPLAEESNLLERESADLAYEASPLEQATNTLEKLDGAQSPNNTETRGRLSQVKARQGERKRRCLAQVAQNQLLMGTARLSPVYNPQIYEQQNYLGGTNPKIPNSSLQTVSYYGKCL